MAYSHRTDYDFMIVSDSDNQSEVEEEFTCLLRERINANLNDYENEKSELYGLNSGLLAPLSVLPKPVQPRARPIYPPDGILDPVQKEKSVAYTELPKSDQAADTTTQNHEVASSDEEELLNVSGSRSMTSSGSPISVDRKYYDGAPEDETKLDERAVHQKRQTLHWRMLALGFVTLFQGIGLCVYYTDVMLVGTRDPLCQDLSYLLILICTAVFSQAGDILTARIGHRWMMVVGCSGSAIFISSKFFHSDYILVGVSPFVGAAQGMFLVSIYCYVIATSQEHANSGSANHRIIFGIYMGLLHTWRMSAPLLAAATMIVLRPTLTATSNSTLSGKFGACAAGYCWKWGPSVIASVTASERLEDTFRVHALLGVHLVFTLGGAGLAFFTLPPIGYNSVPVNPDLKVPTQPGCCSRSSGCTSFALIRDSNLALLIVVIVYAGAQQAIGFTVFLQSFPHCGLGSWLTLAVALTLAAGYVVAAAASGWLAQWLGGMRTMLPCALLQCALLGAFLVVDRDHQLAHSVYYVLAVSWGIAGAGIQVMLSVLIGTALPDRPEANYAQHVFWTTIGQLLVIGLVIGRVCTYVIFGVSVGSLLLAILLYVMFEINARLQVREQKGNVRFGYVPLPEDAAWLPHVDPVYVCKERTRALNNRIPGTKEDVLGSS